MWQFYLRLRASRVRADCITDRTRAPNLATMSIGGKTKVTILVGIGTLTGTTTLNPNGKPNAIGRMSVRNSRRSSLVSRSARASHLPPDVADRHSLRAAIDHRQGDFSLPRRPAAVKVRIRLNRNSRPTDNRQPECPDVRHNRQNKSRNAQHAGGRHVRQPYGDPCSAAPLRPRRRYGKVLPTVSAAQMWWA